MPSPPVSVAAAVPIGRRVMTRLRSDRTAGVSLTIAAIAALVWANFPGDASSYPSSWNNVASVAPLGLHMTVRDWVNQTLLLAFFAVVGLEIRRELTAGELRTVRRAAVPVVAGLTGMAVPALLFVACVAGGRGAGAWGVPMATDVAFALGALALVGTGSARGRVFLMTLAVADDIGSIVVLVVFYSHRTRGLWLAAGLGVLVLLVVVWRRRLRAGPGRAALGLVVWWCMLHAGVDAAVVGVAIGAFGPRRRRAEAGPGYGAPRVRRWLARIEAPVNVIVLPLFALANAGIRIDGSTFRDSAAVRIFAAVVVARVAGKPLGIVAGAVATRRLLPEATQPHVPGRARFGIGAVASIGFTVPLLIIARALPPGPLTVAATAGLLVSSVLGVALGGVLLRDRRLQP